MFRKHFAAPLILVAALGCGADAAEPKSKYVGHVVLARKNPPPGYTQKSLQKLGDGNLSYLQMCVSPAVRVSYDTPGEIDYWVGADDRNEAQRLIDELISRGKRPVRMTFQLIATDKDYADIMGADADPRIANSKDFSEAPLADAEHRKVLEEGKIVGEWVPLGKGFYYALSSMAYRVDEADRTCQVLVLNSEADLTEQDIVRSWDQDTEVIIKFSEEGAKKLKTLTSDQDRQMGIVVDGRVDDIIPPSAPIEGGIMGIYSKVRTPAKERLVSYLKGIASGSPFQFVRSYIEGEQGESR